MQEVWVQRYSRTGGYTKFFRLILQYDNLGNYYKTNFALIQHHKYSLTELENMIPWERDLYISFLMQHLEEEKNRLEQQKLLNKSK